MVPEYWLTEGGQSATGALLDHIVESHLAGPLVANRAASQGIFFFFFYIKDVSFRFVYVLVLSFLRFYLIISM